MGLLFFFFAVGITLSLCLNPSNEINVLHSFCFLLVDDLLQYIVSIKYTIQNLLIFVVTKTVSQLL